LLKLNVAWCEHLRTGTSCSRITFQDVFIYIEVVILVATLTYNPAEDHIPEADQQNAVKPLFGDHAYIKSYFFMWIEALFG